MGGNQQSTVTGLVTYTIDATPDAWTYTAAATATAIGKFTGGSWTQRTSNNLAMNHSSGGAGDVSGSGDSLATGSDTQPYFGGTTDLPSSGTQTQTFRGENTYCFDRASGTRDSRVVGNLHNFLSRQRRGLELRPGSSMTRAARPTPPTTRISSPSRGRSNPAIGA